MVEGLLSRFPPSGDPVGEAVCATRKLLQAERAVLYACRGGTCERIALWQAASDETSARECGVDEVVTELECELGREAAQLLRVPLADGAATIGWLTVVRSELGTERQLRLLRGIVPAFERRLAIERRIDEATLAKAALGPVLDQLRGRAYVVIADGRIIGANKAGYARLERDAHAHGELVACVRTGVAHPGLRLIPLANAEGGYLVLEQSAGAELKGVVRAAVDRFALTKAQARVLDHVAEGLSNAAIAARLGVTERTVETHLTAIYGKANVSGRAALLAAIFDA